ncbi:PREDICTED: olfactory receptor 10G4-like, partial [Cariama cristata]|uniref:olfactory receptor 10G4-like n=1 Tax=Cariama cristata TaxID=54380 RepID=UPI0005201EB4
AEKRHQALCVIHNLACHDLPWRRSNNISFFRDRSLGWKEKSYHSAMTDFILMGLPHAPELNVHHFLQFFTIYIFTLLGSCLMVLILTGDSRLWASTHVLLGKLSFLDLCFSSVFVPKMLVGFLRPGGSPISFHSCMYSSQLLDRDECFLYSVMSYGRCLAICNPLCYGEIMHQSVCIWLVAGTWLASSLLPALHTILTSHLAYCGPRHIYHFFGDLPALQVMACAGTSAKAMNRFSIGGMAVSCFLFTLTSYGCR